MNSIRRLFPAYTEVNQQQAQALSNPSDTWYTVAVKPPSNRSCPAQPTRFVRGILEFQTKWFGLRNASPRVAYEIRRTNPETLTFQFSVPTKRLERKLRTHLKNDIPGVEYLPGTNGLPIAEEDSIGGGLLTTGRRDWYPLGTEFDSPPINSLVGALHRHAMQDTRVVIQVLFQPVIGRPVRSWWRTKRTYQTIGFLRKDKEKLWGSRPSTPRERKQADAIEQKAGTSRFHVSIRVFVIGADEFTPSRLKELAGAFNVYGSPETGQYLNMVTVRSPLKSRIRSFASTVNNREFGHWHLRFQASVPELAALVSTPDRQQRNIETAQP